VTLTCVGRILLKAIWLESIGAPVHIVERPEPAPPADGVVVSVRSVRVPSYTRQVFDGTLNYDLPAPFIPGPACIGQVEKVGTGVFDFEPGQFVLCNSLLSSGETDSSADEILIGWTGTRTARSVRMQNVWRHGSFAEKALYPARCLTPLPGAEAAELPRLAFLASLAIAAGGLTRGGLAAGQTVIINGATGQLGSAAVLVAIARGAGRIIVTGRSRSKLEHLARLSSRIEVAVSSGDRAQDASTLLKICGGADLMVDYLASTPTPAATLAAIDALKVGGTAILVGGGRNDLPLSYAAIVRRRLTIAGSFMFSRETALECWRLTRTGAIALALVNPRTFRLEEIEQAMDAAAGLSGFDLACLMPGG
jgi:alcohol dehydrogenase